jgi:hypothetical protein
MRRSTKYTLAGLAALLCCMATYRIGYVVGTSTTLNAFGPELQAVQVKLGVTKLQRLRELESDLGKGCAPEALAKVRFDIESQLNVLASIYREHKSAGVFDEVAKWDPSIIGQVERFKTQYPNGWTEPACGR